MRVCAENSNFAPLNQIKKKRMKKIAMFLLLLAVALTASAQQQRDSVRTSFDSMYFGVKKTGQKAVPSDVKNVHLWKAGVYERKSATFETMAWTTAALSGVAFSGVLSKKRDVSNMAGCIAGFATAVFLGCHLYYRFASGAELKLSGNTVALTF